MGGRATRNAERIDFGPRIAAYHQTGPRGHLHIQTNAAVVLPTVVFLIDVEARVRARVDNGGGGAPVFVIPEEMDLVFLERAAKRQADLLILVGNDAPRDWISGVESVISEVAACRA